MSALRSARPMACALRAVQRAAQRTSQPVYRHRFASPVVQSTSALALRFNSNAARSAFAKDPIISYEELKPITKNPSDDILLIDVREPDENALGSIPSAVNLPLSELKDALDPGYNPGDFQAKYAFKKPLPNQNIVFFCRSGKRSATAGELAAERGYHNVRNYQGSWLDWSKREKGEDDE